MDAENSPGRQPTPAKGGVVEPAHRALIPAHVHSFSTLPVERYEVRDAMTEVTHRSDNLEQVIAKADEIGSNRFTAIDDDGRRTTIQRVNGEWQRGPQRPPMSDRPLDPAPAQDEMPHRAVDELGNRAPSETATKERDPQTIARLDAQADRAALVAKLEAALVERYLIKRAPLSLRDVPVGNTEYRFRGDTSRVAFTESTFRLATDINSPSVARSMVDVAEARNWRSLRVSGSEDFRRMVWLEASARNVKTLGYEPNPADLDLLKKERESRLVNRIEPARDTGGERVGSTAPTERGSGTRGGGRKAVLAAIEAVLVAKRVPLKHREAVMAAATEKLAQRVRDGSAPKVKVYDKTAPSQRPALVPEPEVQRARQRATPTR